METLEFSFDNDQVDRWFAAYGVETIEELREAMIDKLKAPLVVYEREKAETQAAVKLVAAQAERDDTIAQAVANAEAITLA